MAIHEAALAAMERARLNVPEVIRAFMRVEDVSQERLGEALGLKQGQVSRRLNVPGALSHEELAAIAAYFGVEVSSFYKPWREAISDLPSGGAATVKQAIGGYFNTTSAAA